jgi:hypothetical protein
MKQAEGSDSSGLGKWRQVAGDRQLADAAEPRFSPAGARPERSEDVQVMADHHLSTIELTHLLQ